MRAILLLLALAAACHRNAGASSTADSGPMASTNAVRFDTPRGPWVIRVELARTPEERARGLMFRDHLDPDTGMLFIFAEPEVHSFWMHNTLISLDMIHLGDDRTVVGVVASAPPRNDEPRSVGKPARYVLEVAAGEAAAHFVLPGSRAVFVGISE